MNAELPIPALGRNAARPFLRQAGQFLVVASLACASYFFISHFFLQSVKVVGISMIPTLQDSRQYLLNRWVLHLRAPHRAEVVVLRDPLDHGFSVKRVIAVAGDSVCIMHGAVYVNGQKLAEPYLPPGTATFAPPSLQEQFFKCGAGQYFVLGDNRNYSIDSRAYGPVARRNILGLILQ